MQYNFKGESGDNIKTPKYIGCGYAMARIEENWHCFSDTDLKSGLGDPLKWNIFSYFNRLYTCSTAFSQLQDPELSLWRFCAWTSCVHMGSLRLLQFLQKNKNTKCQLLDWVPRIGFGSAANNFWCFQVQRYTHILKKVYPLEYYICTQHHWKVHFTTQSSESVWECSTKISI